MFMHAHAMHAHAVHAHAMHAHSCMPTSSNTHVGNTLAVCSHT